MFQIDLGGKRAQLWRIKMKNQIIFDQSLDIFSQMACLVQIKILKM